MLFSVIVPTYNRMQLLQQSLASIWGQTFADYEIIVVDGDSTDGTVEYLHSLGSRVCMSSRPNHGPGEARNLGVAQAHGDYIAFLDSDDLWFPWSLKTYASIIRDKSSPAFVAGRPFRFETDDELGCVSYEQPTCREFPDYFASGDEWRWWGVSSFVIRSDVFRSCGGFSEENMNGEDADLALRLGDAAAFVQVTTPYTFAYREHESNLMGNLNKNLAGVWHQITAETRGQYPGGEQRARERWRILTRHMRPISLQCLRQGPRAEAWKLYRATFHWNMALRRWKYLLGFPLKALLS